MEENCSEIARTSAGKIPADTLNAGLPPSPNSVMLRLRTAAAI